MRNLLLAAACGLTVAACAKDASDIAPSYVSPITYQDFTCKQLGEEAERISQRAMEVSGVQDHKATNDKIAMGVGLIVFWPALLLTKGNDETAAEVARLKGTMDVLEQVSIRKNCGIVFQHPAPPPPSLAADRSGEYH